MPKDANLTSFIKPFVLQPKWFIESCVLQPNHLIHTQFALEH
uniref:Uncharacterized protein n=1 Tax=Arundo donax TaxID=35708 RepID=A0A0A9CCX6_ARUDO